MDTKLQKFITQKSGLPKIIVVYGPTGSGKTALAIRLAQTIDSEIISTDSRQIFQYMNIGTGKVTQEDTQGTRHHMIDIITPDTHYSVGEFQHEAERILFRLHGEGKVPILCGGTGLYINSLIYDFDIPKVPADSQFRMQLEKEAKDFGNKFVYDKLVQIDPEYAKSLHPNNLQYVIRALEIKIRTGKSKSEFIKDKVLGYDTMFVTPYSGNREELYNQINLRIEGMFQQGFVDEVKTLLKKGYKKTDFGMQTIGYTEVIDYLEGNLSLQDTIHLVQKRNRNYAKKQLTWFRDYRNDGGVLL